MSQDTPMLRQYKAIKSDYQDCILFFRLGDFYEMFLEDAKVAAKALNLTLTGRGKDENRIPMCGIPYHARDNYIRNLIEQGFKVAICEQTEAADASKGLTKREVVQIITPSTLLDDNAHREGKNNFLMAIQEQKNQYAIALIDYSSGDFQITTLTHQNQIESYLHQCQIKEVLVDEKNPFQCKHPCLTNPVLMPSIQDAKARLKKAFNVTQLAGFGIGPYESCYPVAAACLNYLEKTQKNHHLPLKNCQALPQNNSLLIDEHSSQHLELFSHQQGAQESLFSFLNHCKTPMGTRKLAQRLRHPSCDKITLEKRLNQVEVLHKNPIITQDIQSNLTNIGDIERSCNKIWSNNPNPKDLINLKEQLLASLSLTDPLEKLPQHADLASLKKAFTQEKQQRIKEIISKIQSAILDEAPNHLRDGNIFKAGYSQELDNLNQQFSDIRSWINTLEQKEKETHQIKALKVRYNKVFGYYIEVPKAQQHMVPDTYIRKQTLTNAERYITAELKDKEQILLQGQNQQVELEQQLYEAFLNECQPFISHIHHRAEWIAQLDVIQSMASLALTNNLCRPHFCDEDSYLHLENSRHPILEKTQQNKVIENTLTLNKNHNCMMLTGPNMAGKSTLMRQVALTVIMAQIGSYVAASNATLSLCDKIFTRIGASDNLYAGQSTFMVEMIETANIIHNATSKSLIILDEIGRGTATYDGMSIAAAVLKHLQLECKAKCLFATHYHELSQILSDIPGIKAQRMGVKIINNKLLFTYTLEEGNADSSYGLTVAKMAGFPDNVLKEAQNILIELEEKDSQHKVHKAQQKGPKAHQDQLLLWH